ncbi:MAG: helix-turn-helix domain-containing protein [Gammaproteobacteria bacterium]|nr:helix-turn-helix domain-containing protein [Gammaproteobacteria bacterium]
MPATRETKSQENAAASLGARLHAAREALGLSVHKAAQDMHVSDDIIEALERNDFTHLGAPIFVRGHLRNYARLLGLPENEILEAEHAADKLSPPPLVTQTPIGGHAFAQRYAMPVFSLLIAALLLALGIVWWLYRPVPQNQTSPAVQTPGTTQQAVTQSPTATSSPLSEAVPAPHTGNLHTPGKKPLESLRQEPVPAVLKPVRRAAAAVEVPPAKRSQAHLATTHGTAATPSKLLVYAQFNLSQPSWIEVYDASGKRLYYSLAPAGDKFEVSGAAPLQVFLGNAPGVSVELNGAAFNFAPFIHSDNTAHFNLGAAAGSKAPAG